jgi:hypothetical protein
MQKDMGETCSTRVEDEKYKILVAKAEGKRPLRRPKRRWEDNSKQDLK